jgi:hypothetical protein
LGVAAKAVGGEAVNGRNRKPLPPDPGLSVVFWITAFLVVYIVAVFACPDILRAWCAVMDCAH